ncbi:hypothetical protein RUM44_011120 [Polyplax serrata]|uniref:Uncharacterized protein n=1 Tax=Polyplax serrata TaxID=468196 RepID=A0ABR1AP64_POLSC
MFDKNLKIVENFLCLSSVTKTVSLLGKVTRGCIPCNINVGWSGRFGRQSVKEAEEGDGDTQTET